MFIALQDAYFPYPRSYPHHTSLWVEVGTCPTSTFLLYRMLHIIPHYCFSPLYWLVVTSYRNGSSLRSVLGFARFTPLHALFRRFCPPKRAHVHVSLVLTHCNIITVKSGDLLYACVWYVPRAISIVVMLCACISFLQLFFWNNRLIYFNSKYKLFNLS